MPQSHSTHNHHHSLSSSIMRPSSPFSAKYTPSTRAANLSRLLDPTYSSPSPSYFQSVYVDHYGNLHDPDYRDFSPLPPPRRASPITPRHSSHSARPSWEIATPFDDSAYSENGEDGDDDNDDDFFSDSPIGSSSYQPSLITYGATHYRSPSFPSYTYNYYSSPESSPSNMFSSDQTDDDASLFSFRKERRRIMKKYRAACSKVRSEKKTDEMDEMSTFGVHETDEDVGATRETRSDAGVAANGDSENELDEEFDWTPTCTQLMLRQWQAISLRVRFRVFAAQRMLRKHFSNGS